MPHPGKVQPNFFLIPPSCVDLEEVFGEEEEEEEERVAVGAIARRAGLVVVNW